MTDVGETFHPGDKKTSPSAWIWRTYEEHNEWMVALPRGELVGEFSRGDVVFIAKVDNYTWSSDPWHGG